MSQEEELQTWWVTGSTSRKLMGAWSVFAVLLVGVVVVTGEAEANNAPWLILFTLMAASNWTNNRQRTQAGPSGLVVTRPVRTRRIGWQDVCDIDTGPAGRWATWVQAKLTDGSTVQLLGVPPSELERLQGVQRMHRAG